MQQPPTNDEPTERQCRGLLAPILRLAPNSMLIANVVILTAIVDALLWYRWAVDPTQNAGWLFAAGVLTLLVLTLLVLTLLVLTLLVLTLLVNLHRLDAAGGKNTCGSPDSLQEVPRDVVTPDPPPPSPSLSSPQPSPPPPPSPQPPP